MKKYLKIPKFANKKIKIKIKDWMFDKVLQQEDTLSFMQYIDKQRSHLAL